MCAPASAELVRERCATSPRGERSHREVLSGSVAVSFEVGFSEREGLEPMRTTVFYCMRHDPSGHTHTHTHTQAQPHTHTNTYTHTHSHTATQPQTHTDTHTGCQIPIHNNLRRKPKANMCSQTVYSCSALTLPERCCTHTHTHRETHTDGGSVEVLYCPDPACYIQTARSRFHPLYLVPRSLHCTVRESWGGERER